MREIAVSFGVALDEDDFDRAAILLAPACVYTLGDEVHRGVPAIIESYRRNMIAGRAKLDALVWGTSTVSDSGPYRVHFTDYLTHRGVEFTHRSAQRLTVEDQLITDIAHIADPTGDARLAAFLRRVGLS